MADNTSQQGTDTIATDDIGGVKYQRVKATWGSDGTATDVDASNPLPTVQTGALPAGTNVIGHVVVDSGTVTTNSGKATTAAQTSVVAAITSTALLASNSSRVTATIFNDSTVAMYVNLGASASTTAFVVKLAAASYYEIPAGYTGAINGIWDSATGNARVCQLT